MTECDDPQLTGPLADHAIEIEERLAEFDRRVKAARLTIAVLGPGRGDQAGFAKRRQILDTLNGMPGVRAFFPEPEESPEWVAYLQERYLIADDDIDRLETVQFMASDVILALETSPGAEQEVARYAKHPKISPKLVSLMPERYRETANSSYAGHLRRDLRKEYFSDEELQECGVATKIAPTIAMQFKLDRA